MKYLLGNKRFDGEKTRLIVVRKKKAEREEIESQYDNSGGSERKICF